MRIVLINTCFVYKQVNTITVLAVMNVDVGFRVVLCVDFIVLTQSILCHFSIRFSIILYRYFTNVNNRIYTEKTTTCIRRIETNLLLRNYRTRTG